MVIRCSNCGSKKVNVNEVNGGYNLKEGAIGVAVFGAKGAILGVNGKTNVSYHCQECGERLSKPMDSETSKKIDDLINKKNKTFEDELYLRMKKSIYKNIEWENTEEAIIRNEPSHYEYEERTPEEEKRLKQKLKADKFLKKNETIICDYTINKIFDYSGKYTVAELEDILTKIVNEKFKELIEQEKNR